MYSFVCFYEFLDVCGNEKGNYQEPCLSLVSREIYPRLPVLNFCGLAGKAQITLFLDDENNYYIVNGDENMLQLAQVCQLMNSFGT